MPERFPHDLNGFSGSTVFVAEILPDVMDRRLDSRPMPAMVKEGE